MLITAHLAVGLIIGKVFDNYPAAIIGSTFLDLDHFISYVKSGIIFKPKKLFYTLTKREDEFGDQRNIFHKILSFIVISSLFILFNKKLGIIFSISYLGHLIVDFLDNSDSFPLFLNKKINIKGPIKYFSKAETIFTLLLILVFFLLK